MKTCPKCGQRLDDSAKFCNNCGSSLPSAAQQGAQFCSNCGQRLAAGAVFCVSCGTPAGNSGNPVPPQPTGSWNGPSAQPNAGYQYTAGSVPPSGQAGPMQPPVPSYRAPQPDVFCPNCGERVPAGSTFCPNCHMILQPRQSGGNVRVQSGAKKSKAPLFIAAGAVAAVALIVAAVLLIPRLFGSRTPQNTFVAAQEELFVTPLLDAMETEMDTYGSGKLSTDITLSASVNSSEINRYLTDSSVVLKLDADQANLLASGDLILMGSPVLSGTLTYEGGKLGFYLPELDDRYYVLDLSSLLSSAGIYNVDLSNIKMPEISGKEWRALAEAYLDVVYSMVTKENLTVEQRQSYSLPELGGSCTGMVYTFEPTAADLQAMLEKLADRLEKDKDLRSLILKLVNPETLLLSMSGNAYGYGYNSNYDYEAELDEALREMASELREQARYIGQSTQDVGLTWTLCMEGKEVRMVRLANSYGSAMVFERSGTEAKGCTQLFYEESYGENNVLLKNTYTKKGDVYDGTLTINDDYSYDSVTVSYNMNTGKRSVLGIPYGSYSLYAPYEDVSLSMEVSEGKSGSTDHVISIQGDNYTFGGTFTRLELTVNTTKRSSAKKPAERPTDITYYSESELSDLMYELSSRMEDALYEAMYGLW